MNKNVFKVLFLTVVGFSTFQENLYGGIKTISNMKIRASKPVSPYSNQIRIQNTLKKRKIELKQMISDTLEKDDAENKAKEYNKLYLSIRNNVDSFNKANRSFLEDLILMNFY